MFLVNSPIALDGIQGYLDDDEVDAQVSSLRETPRNTVIKRGSASSKVLSNGTRSKRRVTKARQGLLHPQSRMPPQLSLRPPLIVRSN